MEPMDPNEKIEYWKEHLRKLALFEGTQGSYAEQNGISASKLSYYKTKFAPHPSFAKLVPEKKPLEKPSSPSVIADRNGPRLPDAKWLATFLKEFLR